MLLVSKFVQEYILFQETLVKTWKQFRTWKLSLKYSITKCWSDWKQALPQSLESAPPAFSTFCFTLPSLCLCSPHHTQSLCQKPAFPHFACTVLHCAFHQCKIPCYYLPPLTILLFHILIVPKYIHCAFPNTSLFICVQNHNYFYFSTDRVSLHTVIFQL